MAVAHCSRKSEAKPKGKLTTAASRTSESALRVEASVYVRDSAGEFA